MPNPLLDMVMSGGPASAGPSMPMPNPGAAQGSSNPLLDMVLNGGADAGGNAPPPGLALGGGSAQPPSPAPQQPAGSTWDEFGRQIGLTARAGINGVAAIPGVFADAATGVYNTAADAVAGKDNGFRFRTTQSALNDLEDRLGLPKPQNATERVVQDATAGMAGVGGMSAAGTVASKAVSPIAQKLAAILTSRPLVTTVSGATGPAAASTVREGGGGPGAQLAAGVAGAAGPVVAADGVGALVRALTGNTPSAKINQAVSDFAAAGATPTVGQATQSRTARALESALSRVPGGAGPMVAKAEGTAANVGAKVGELADNLAPNADATSAGMAISSGVKGEDPASFLSTFRNTQEQLYGKLDGYIPKDATVDVTNTRQALADLNQDIDGAKALSAWFKNGRIQGIEKALTEDVGASVPPAQAALERAPIYDAAGQPLRSPTPQTNGLPFEAVKKLRTLVGRELQDGSVMSDVPRSKWQALYGALSKDIGQAADAAGPQASAAWSRANNYTRAGMERLGLLESAVNQQTPERIFQAATAGSREGATMLRAVMKSVPVESQKQTTAAFLNRMGQAAPGAQNDTGTAFSIQTFLSNWAKLSPEARQTLFSRPGYDSEFATNLDKIARVANNLREGSKVFANPSGTGQAVSLTGALGSALYALATGNVKTGAGIAAATGTANVLSRAMTNPGAVRWLANLADKPSAMLPAQINTLVQTAGKLKDRDMQDLANRLQKNGPKSLRDTITDAVNAAGDQVLSPAIAGR